MNKKVIHHDFQSDYEAKKPDEKGFVPYTPEEHQIWRQLVTAQRQLIQHRACKEYLQGLRFLDFQEDEIPQCKVLSQRLQQATGWTVKPVESLISYHEFFHLLANKQFPAATFIRRKESLHYLKEPDIFHEFFGHCPMITHPIYASFMQAYGRLGLHATEQEQALLARLYWFTVEFGLIKTKQGLRIYGGGILSSIEETPYAIEHPVPIRKPFDVMTALRTPYRIDHKQPIYFIIEDFQQLYNLLENDLLGKIRQAIELADFDPVYFEGGRDE